MRVGDYFEQAIRVPRVLWAALMASQVLLMAVLFMQRAHLEASHPPAASMIAMMWVVSASITAFSFIFPGRMHAQNAKLRPAEVVPSEPTGGQPRPRFASPMKAARQAMALSQTALILKMALAESVALNGFALGFLGAPLEAFLPFFVAGLALAAVRFPTVPNLVGPYERAHGATFAASDDHPGL